MTDRTPRTPGAATSLPRRGFLGLTAALAASFGSGVGARRAGAAWQATPTASPTLEGDGEGETVDPAAVIQFVHFEKYFSAFGITLAPEQLAELYGIDAATYQAIRAEWDANARAAATELLADAEVAAQVDALPFAPGDRIFANGDSITDDLQSWAAILGHLLALRRPDDAILIDNRAISDDTTTDALRQFVPALQGQPAWIITLLGTNDASRNGREAAKTAVSVDETLRNLAAMRHLARRAADPALVWLTPPACDEAAIANSPFAAASELTIRNADLAAIAAGTLALGDPAVDLFTLFSDDPLLLPDGIHPSLDGQQAITRALLPTLAR